MPNLKEPTESALQSNATYRSALKAPDGFAIANKDQSRVYRWVSRTLLDKAGGFDRRGWEVIDSKNSKGESIYSPWGKAASGTSINNEDLVLCYMPKERADQKRDLLRQANNLVRSSVRALRSMARSEGARITGNIETQKSGVTETY